MLLIGQHLKASV